MTLNTAYGSHNTERYKKLFCFIPPGTKYLVALLKGVYACVFNSFYMKHPFWQSYKTPSPVTERPRQSFELIEFVCACPVLLISYASKGLCVKFLLSGVYLFLLIYSYCYALYCNNMF